MVLVKDDLTKEISAAIAEENTFVVTDKNVEKFYPLLFRDCNKFVIEPGEDSKKLDTMAAIARKMLECGADRKTKIIAVGGGVVGDIAGFTASVFMRGVEWTSVPTTLLAQVDSGVGGKTAVDLDDYKNIIGTFYQPTDVLVSLRFLETLPERERLCGLGEIIKTAFLDTKIFSIVESGLNKLISFDRDTLYETVKECIAFKEKIVAEDEKEITGKRKILNLGHTIGHAVEKTDKHRLSHGEYVLWGLLYESYITKNFISYEYYLYMTALVKKVLKGRKLKFDSLAVADAAAKDKKNGGGRISIIAAVDKGEQKELFFSRDEIFEGLERCKKELSL